MELSTMFEEWHINLNLLCEKDQNLMIPAKATRLHKASNETSTDRIVCIFNSNINKSRNKQGCNILHRRGNVAHWYTEITYKHLLVSFFAGQKVEWSSTNWWQPVLYTGQVLFWGIYSLLIVPRWMICLKSQEFNDIWTCIELCSQHDIFLFFGLLFTTLLSTLCNYFIKYP